eukprot:3268468-Pleurochrysis_carterae.AAC.2
MQIALDSTNDEARSVTLSVRAKSREALKLEAPLTTWDVYLLFVRSEMAESARPRLHPAKRIRTGAGHDKERRALRSHTCARLGESTRMQRPQRIFTDLTDLSVSSRFENRDPCVCEPTRMQPYTSSCFCARPERSRAPLNRMQ